MFLSSSYVFFTYSFQLAMTIVMGRGSEDYTGWFYNSASNTEIIYQEVYLKTNNGTLTLTFPSGTYYNSIDEYILSAIA